MKQTLFFVAGEHSGDQRGAALIAALKKSNPSFSFVGLGGREMARAGCNIVFDLPSIAALGFTDVLKKYGKFRSVFTEALKQIESVKPAAVILIDFPGFNIRLAKKIKKRFPVIYYVSPQVWAWAPFRKYTLAKHVHKMLTLFRFEEDVYKGTGLDVKWVGHPLVDQLHREGNVTEIRKRLGIPENKTVIGLLPGSRESEVSRMLPIMLNTAKIIFQKKPDSFFLLSRSNTVDAKIFENSLKAFAQLPVLRLDGQSEQMLSASDFSLICSGTATLEATVLKAPFLVIYKTAYLTYLFARNLMHIPYIGMANVLAKKMIVPEFVQHNAEPERIAEKALYYLNNPEAVRKMKKDLESVLPELGEGKAAERAAGAITDFLQTVDSLSASTA